MAGASRSSSWLRWLRNLLIGSAVLWVSYAYLAHAILSNNYTSYGSGPAITQVCVVWAILFVLWSAASRRFPSALRITQDDLLFLFVFLLLAGPMMYATMSFFTDNLWVYRNNPANRYGTPGAAGEDVQKVLAYNLPRVAPSDEAIETFYRGSADSSVDWRAWLGAGGIGDSPAVAWGIYALLILGICFGFVFVISRRWMEEEQLAFPLAQFGSLLIGGSGGGQSSGGRMPLLSTKAFWIGFAFTLGFQIATYYNPGLEWRVGSFYIKGHNEAGAVPLLGYLDYASRAFWWRPVLLAMIFLCPRQILGSMIFFHVTQAAFTIMGGQLGYFGYTGSPLGATGQFSGNIFPFKTAQLLGGAGALVVIVLYLARSSLAQQARCCLRIPMALVRGKPALCLPGLGMLLLVVSTLGFVAWTGHMGFSPMTTVLFLASIFLAVTVNTRGRAEIGMPLIIVFSSFGPTMWIPMLGTRLVGLKTVAASYVHGWLFGTVPHNANNFLHVTPSLADSMKMGQSLRRSYYWIAGVALAAIVVGIVLGGYVTMSNAYENGARNWRSTGSDPGWGALLASKLMVDDVPFNWVHAAYATAGAAIYGAVWLLRNTFTGFPLHPMGYLLSLHPGLHHFSLSVFIAYAVKTLSLRYGGMKAYLALVPAFMGLLCGQILGGAAVGIVNMYTTSPVYVPMF